MSGPTQGPMDLVTHYFARYRWITRENFERFRSVLRRALERMSALHRPNVFDDEYFEIFRESLSVAGATQDDIDWATVYFVRFVGIADIEDRQEAWEAICQHLACEDIDIVRLRGESDPAHVWVRWPNRPRVH